MMTIVSTAMLGITGLLGFVMGATGVQKFTGAHAEEFDRYGYPQWFRLTTGALESLGGVGLLAGLVVEGTVALVGGGVVAVVLVGAIATHVRVGDPVSSLAPAVVLFVLSLAVVAHHAGVTV